MLLGYFASNGTPAENDIYGKDYAIYNFGKGMLLLQIILGKQTMRMMEL
jgi:hypothetical protein